MFTRNTRDSSCVNPEGKARGIYIWTVEYITHKHRWGVVWVACTTAGIQIIVMLLAFTCSLLYQTGMFHRALSGSGALLYCWLYPTKQAVNCFMLFARLDHVLFSHLEHSVKEVLIVALSARAVGLLIVRIMNNITGPTDARIQPGYKLNCTWQVEVGGL